MRWARGIVLFLPHGVETQTCSNSSENLCESDGGQSKHGFDDSGNRLHRVTKAQY